MRSQSRLELRPAVPGDLDLLLSAQPHEPIEFIDAERFGRELDLGQYRFDWSWLCMSDGRLMARALWWGSTQATHPVSLDCLWVHPSVSDPAALAAELVAAGHSGLRAAGLPRLPDLNLSLAPGWRDDAQALKAEAWRVSAVAKAGLTEKTERLSFAWTRGSALPRRSTRLTFGPGDDDAFLAVFAEVATNSLDLLTRRQVAQLGAQAQAEDDLAFYRGLPGERQLWRLAFDKSDSCVGFIIPARSAYDASVSYLGVVPQHRGQGYVDDLLAEITHVHAERGEPRITGTTDTTNAPMAASFLRCAYVVTKSRVVVSAPPA
jgi:ribosomal protein S18 acetylase RimI-like enzyme